MKLSKVFSNSSALAVLATAALTAALTATLTACPEERKEITEKVGGAPKEQVDVARERLGKAEDKLQQNAAVAAATE